jgi:hypothetical protein
MAFFGALIGGLFGGVIVVVATKKAGLAIIGMFAGAVIGGLIASGAF